MASVYEVYNIIKDLANKDERGMISPAQFNAFAGIAQQKVYNGLFEEIQDNTRDYYQSIENNKRRNKRKSSL